MFICDLLDARTALEAFMPRAGLEYARHRNYDTGSGHVMHVSRLSPWVRLRVIPEWELVTEVLQQHSATAASKFIDEVCWRTYWKCWLRRRPAVWDAYLTELEENRQQMADSKLYHALLSAESGIDCMDAWARELTDTGYLHNHARMWFASIWIHTLKLPWALGADFFFRHLLDGDPASNTLSWRWVAGLHTEGKAYLATAENIKKYSDGRFDPQIQFATTPVSVFCSSRNPPAGKLEPLASLPESKRVGRLLHEEDLSALHWLGDEADVIATAGFIPQQCYCEHDIAPSVFDFRHHSMKGILEPKWIVYTQLSHVIEWAQATNLDVLLMAEPPIGIWSQVLSRLENELQKNDIQLVLQRHWWDEHFHPHAQAGFFRFKKAIPAAIEQLT